MWPSFAAHWGRKAMDASDAVVLRDVGPGAALELVGALARVPDQQVVAVAALHVVVAARLADSVG